MRAIGLPDTVLLPIGEITPYDRNPRRIPPEAIAAVATSIQTYGYQQPIVVDKDYVVIVGHTRLAALQSLGWEEVPVYVSDLPAEKAKEYRLVDNRTSEMTAWDYGALVLELREWEADLLERFFPDVDLEIATVDAAGQAVTEDEIAAATDEINRIKERDPLLSTQVTCPACFHTFEVRTDSLPGLTRDEVAQMREAQAASAE